MPCVWLENLNIRTLKVIMVKLQPSKHFQVMSGFKTRRVWFDWQTILKAPKNPCNYVTTFHSNPLTYSLFIFVAFTLSNTPHNLLLPSLSHYHKPKFMCVYIWKSPAVTHAFLVGKSNLFLGYSCLFPYVLYVNGSITSSATREMRLVRIIRCL